MKMTEVLLKEPNFIEARNWRARAIFFLGNPDLAVAELNKIVAALPPKSPETLDALYLIGAIIYESNDSTAHRVRVAVNAWETYLERAEPPLDLKKEILDSLAELKHRKEGESTPPSSADPFLPHPNFKPEKNAILVAFAKDELNLALSLANAFLDEDYDKAIATVKARIFFKQGRVDEAVSMFEAIVSKDKSYAPGYHYQGMAFMLKGEVEKAISSWEETIKQDPIYAESHRLLQRIAAAKKIVGRDQ
jgi:tetratricopeptide (TPR) repeat protein